MADVSYSSVCSTKRSRLHQWQWCANITIEPAYALFCLVDIMGKFFYQNLLLQKSCRFNLTNEPDLTTSCDNKEIGLSFVAMANSWFLSPATLLSAVFTVFAMTWSDRAGKRRRPLIFIPLIGFLLECKFAAIQSYFWHWSAISVLIPYTLTQALFGGRICFTQSAYLYLTDITNNENRSARYSSLLAIRYFCLPVGSAASGFLLRRVGFFYSFMVCYILTALALALSIILIRDTSEPLKKKLKFIDMIDPKNSIKAVKVILKKRPQNSRLILILLLTVFSLFSFTFDGELSVVYLYFLQEFHWDEKQYGVYIAFKLFLICIGTIVGSLIFIKLLKMTDGIILIFIGGIKTVAAICYLLARQTWEIYCISLIDCYFALGITVSRSFATKLVENHEYGYLAAVISLTKMTVSFSQLLYNAVFSVTMKTFPASFFLISGVLSALILIFAGISHYLYKKQAQMKPNDALLIQ